MIVAVGNSSLTACSPSYLEILNIDGLLKTKGFGLDEAFRYDRWINLSTPISRQILKKYYIRNTNKISSMITFIYVASFVIMGHNN